uniref:Uncharacterized protein n=1 Tax=Magallana gigas TaxID=29159 RepID=A0A8W8MEA4_MAGGI
MAPLRAVRQVIRKLKEDVENPLVVDYDKFENNDIRTIVREVRRSYTNYDWGSGTIEEALRRVWRNMRDEERRREKGKKELHRRQSKQAKRIRDKLKKVTDEDEPTQRVAIPFVWESSLLWAIKCDLDRGYSDSLGIQQRRQKSKVTRSATEMTMTPPPRDIPGWAISTTYHLDG